MRFSLTAAVAALAAIPHATATFKDVDEWDILAGKALANQVLYQFTKPRYTDSECTPFNAAVRREWYVLVQSYIASRRANDTLGDPSPSRNARSTLML
jgi:tyrosinase